MADQTTKTDVYWSCGALAAIIFLIDLNIPLGVASGVPYIAVILLSLRSPKKRFTVGTAIGCTLLVGLGAWGSPPAPTDVPVYQVWANRSLTVLAIWITATLTLIQRDKTKALYEEQMKNQQLEKKR